MYCGRFRLKGRHCQSHFVLTSPRLVTNRAEANNDRNNLKLFSLKSFDAYQVPAGHSSYGVVVQHIPNQIPSPPLHRFLHLTEFFESQSRCQIKSRRSECQSPSNFQVFTVDCMHGPSHSCCGPGRTGKR